MIMNQTLKNSITTEGARTNDSSTELGRLIRYFGGRITASSKGVLELSNGLAYYFVEVTCSNGTQIGIPAYGDEAIALYEETKRMLAPTMMVRS